MTTKTFEKIRHLNDDGIEYWLARELQEVLQYTQWRNFERVIDTAKIACSISKHEIADHFAGVSKTVEMPSKARRKQIKKG
jgi:DNA-damage-inducible protein D